MHCIGSMLSASTQPIFSQLWFGQSTLLTCHFPSFTSIVKSPTLPLTVYVASTPESNYCTISPRYTTTSHSPFACSFGAPLSELFVLLNIVGINLKTRISTIDNVVIIPSAIYSLFHICSLQYKRYRLFISYPKEVSYLPLQDMHSQRFLQVVYQSKNRNRSFQSLYR